MAAQRSGVFSSCVRIVCVTGRAVPIHIRCPCLGEVGSCGCAVTRMMDNTDKRDNAPTPAEVRRRLAEQIPPNWQLCAAKSELRRGPDVAPSQAVADLLTGPGRNPSEGEELLDWMRKNEGVWRT
jgi:hypothetical protein